MKHLGWLVLLLALGGCAHAPGGSVAGGECKFLERPQYVVRGVRQYDQDWIDSTVEGGVGACGWQRPAPRPAEIDAVAPQRPKVVHKPKVTIWKMLHAWPRKKVKPVAATPIVEPLPPPEPPAPPPAPPTPRKPIDELLGTVQ